MESRTISIRAQLRVALRLDSGVRPSAKGAVSLDVVSEELVVRHTQEASDERHRP